MPTKFWCLLLILVLCPFRAQARWGGSDGGGGGAIVCPGRNGQITAELVDLVESTFYEKLRINPNLANLPWRRQVEIVTSRMGMIDPEFNERLRLNTDRITEAMATAFDQTKGTQIVFPAPGDIGAGRLPPLTLGCQLLGAATYVDTTFRLDISEVIWKSFNETHKAGLVVHESAYLTLREINPQRPPSSIDVRKFVGLAFSKEIEDVLTDRVIRELRAKFQSPAEPNCSRDFSNPISDHPTNPNFRRLIEEIKQVFIPALIRRHTVCYFSDLERSDEFRLTSRWHANPRPYCRVRVEELSYQSYRTSPQMFSFYDVQDGGGASDFKVVPGEGFVPRHLQFSMDLVCSNDLPYRNQFGEIDFRSLFQLERFANGRKRDEVQDVSLPLVINEKNEWRYEFLRDYVITRPTPP